jgi:TolA-binding protein
MESTQFKHNFFTSLLIWVCILLSSMEDDVRKPIIATFIALFMTACVGVAIFAVGGAALLNKNGVQASNQPGQAQPVSFNAAQDSSQVAQLQSLITQYQDREKQYQQREQQLQDQLNQANSQLGQTQQTVQQAQMLLQALQERGLIRITNDGRIFIQ